MCLVVQGWREYEEESNDTHTCSASSLLIVYDGGGGTQVYNAYTCMTKGFKKNTLIRILYFEEK